MPLKFTFNTVQEATAAIAQYAPLFKKNFIHRGEGFRLKLEKLEVQPSDDTKHYFILATLHGNVKGKETPISDEISVIFASYDIVDA